MVEAQTAAGHHPELPDLIGLVAELNKDNFLGSFLHFWESTIYALLVIGILTWFFRLATRPRKVAPGPLQNGVEYFVTFIDDFICGIMGPKGRKFTPFIGTLFVYILAMNYLGLIPFLKSPTSSLSTTVALALIVFFYMLYTGFKELGFFGFFHHLIGQPKAFTLMTVVIAVIMFVLETISYLVRPLSLSLRLRSNIYSDDMMLATFASQGVSGFVWLLPNFIIVLLTSALQAGVFAILTMIYFSMLIKHDEAHH